MNQSGLITVNELVYEMLNDLDKPSKEQFMRYKQFVVRALNQMNIFVLKTIRVEYITVDDQNNCPLPNDFSEYSKIGIVVNGRIWTLTVNPKMSLQKYEACGIPVRDIYSQNDVSTITSMNVVPFAPYNYNGIYYDNMYGVGGGWNTTYYRIDLDGWRIILDGQIMTDQIVLEYVSNGISENGTTFIPLAAKEAVLAYAHFLRVDNDDNVSLGEKQRKEQRRDKELRLLVSINSPTIDECMDAIYRGHRLGIHR